MTEGLLKDGDSKEANEKVGKKGGKLSKYKWQIIGGLAVIAILVFYFSRKSSSNSNAAGTTGTANTGVDPSTGLPYASEYGYGGLGGFGMTGPAGPAGPAGPPGKRGPQGPPGKPPKVHHHKHQEHKVHVTSGGQMHPAVQLAGWHAQNQHRAITPSPRRAA